MEFTDTAIDFTETAGYSSPSPAKPRHEEETVSETKPRTPRIRQAQATVRHYRINPERMVPLLVVLSKKEILEVVKQNIAQGKSEHFQVALGSLVEVEPILPGCSCYPPKEHLLIREEEVQTTFWVVPHVLGRVMQAACCGRTARC